MVPSGLRCLAAALLVALPVEAVAQTAAEQVRQALPRDESNLGPLPAPVEIEFATQQAPVNADQLTFRLNDVALDYVGDWSPEARNRVDPAALRAIYADLAGQEITLDQAFGFIARIQAAYRDAGLIFTRVLAAPQTIEDGVFRIVILASRIGTVEIAEPENFDTETRTAVLPLVRGIAKRLEGLSNPTVRQLERAVLLINDIPGIGQATAVPRAGTAQGEVDLFVNIVRTPFSGVVFADNRQSPVLGPGLVGGSVNFDSYTYAGDSTKISLFNSFGDESDDEPDYRERSTIQIDHQRNIGTSGLLLRARGLFSRSRPGEEVEQLGLEGEQLEGRLALEYPFLRTRRLSVWGFGGFDYRDSDLDSTASDVRFVDDRLRILFGGARALQKDRYGYTLADISLRQGVDILDATDDEQRNRSRIDGEAVFTLVRGSIEREIVLPVTNNRFSIFLFASGQYSFDPVLSAEEYTVGGPEIGRAFDPSELSGDNGYGVLAEARYEFLFDALGQPIGLQLYAFADYGEVDNIDDGLPEGDSLSSYGGGIRLNLPYRLSVNLEVAQPLDDLQRTGEDDPRFFFGLVKNF